MTNNLTHRHITRPMSRPNMIRSTNRLTQELKALVEASPSKHPAMKHHARIEVNKLIELIQILWSE